MLFVPMPVLCSRQCYARALVSCIDGCHCQGSVAVISDATVSINATVDINSAKWRMRARAVVRAVCDKLQYVSS